MNRSISKILTLAALMVAFSPFICQAQNTFKFLSSGTKDGSATPAVCIREAQTAVTFITRFPHPANWQWAVACDDHAWADLVRHLGWDSRGATLFALTDRATHVTYLRGSTILNPLLIPAAAPEHIIAHELAHVYLGSSDEGKVDALAWRWQSDATRANVASK